MRLWQWLITVALFLLLVSAEARLRRHRKRRFVTSHFDELYCGESANAQSQFEEERESNSSKVSSVHSTQFNWGLDNTICIKLQNVVHVLKYERLEQRYPIESSYTFSVPLIDTTCKCHCYGFGSNDVCNVEKFADDRNCTINSEYPTCYTKYHSAVEPLDCPVTSIPAKACCEIKLKPRDGRMFRAVKLQQPINDMIITHSIFANNSGKIMKVLGPEEYRINLLKGKEQFELTEYHRISVQLVASSPQQQLREGMYYFPEENHNDLREGKINEITESDLDKLGWYRRIGNDWQVATNGLLLRNAHKVVIKNCKGQLHMDQFSGTKNFVLRGTQYNDTYYEKKVTENNFVRSVKVDESSREITIVHEHGTAAQVSLKTDTRPNLTKSQSLLANFTGSITLDHDGNRMLNVTFFGVKGTVHIKMYVNDRKLVATFACTAQFGTTIKDDGSRISLPSSINQAQWVCILPDEQPDKSEICKWIPYEEKAMRTPRQEQSWSKGHSPCSQAECNSLKSGVSDLFPWIINFDYFMAHGGDFTEWLKMGIHIVIAVGLLFLLIILFTKCLVPLACCSLSIPFKSRNKKKKKNSSDY
ncbi:hypothetical protein GCK72_006357 [Caenorhabditis remanei]|uniref:Uncharacterized protein n=1 Tax=Caenorhabditis remanei TaxID=31234 RepID=A0A6A5HEX8_CAERE|nr:hypothetical protein GCK72_006357 [Caenorhabditis remanei]KAF1766400.1 hypothetical protein GCK72_006357 [Caenorhabditis remanei]